MEFDCAIVPSPVGDLHLVLDPEGRLRALDFHGFDERMHRLLARQYGTVALRPAEAPARLAQALAAYFAGEFDALDGIETKTAGTPFQEATWAALRTIRPGQTMSYGALAARLGNPKASRAVGLANGANPVAIVVPCHRVIGANGTLTGFGGGIERKRWLLAHEAAHTPAFAQLSLHLSQ